MALELYDKDFLLALDKYPHREVYCRVIALNWDENPVAEITSNVVSGSINVDGSSAVRRTASLSLVTNDLKVDTVVWRVQTKIKILVGLRNYLRDLPQDEITERYQNYDEIIWFPQGLFVITSFNSSYSNSGYTINISAKDKMCLLNGDVSGALWASHDFSQLYITKENGDQVKTYIPIYNIIQEAVHVYAKEPYSNIIINDLDGCGVELVEYIGNNATMYIFKQSLNADQQGAIWTYQIAFDTSSPSLVNNILEPAIAANNGVDEGATKTDNGVTYVVQKRINPQLSTDRIAGYRATELTYPGELVIAVGGTIVELLNKIISLLGEFEFFYDLEGHFVFQRKKIYVNTVWSNAVTNENTTYYDSMTTATNLSYDFVQGMLISSFSNTPQLNSIKNDFSIWGSRKTASGSEVSVHLRYAIDNKPNIYYSMRKKKTFISTTINSTIESMENLDANEFGVYDWRELIYQMAYDNLYAETAIASLKLALTQGYYHYDDSKCSWSSSENYFKYDTATKSFVRITSSSELSNCLSHGVFIFGKNKNKVTIRLTEEQKAKISKIIGGDYALYQLGYPLWPNPIDDDLSNLVTKLVQQFTAQRVEDMIVEEIKEWQQTYTTGYESYYADILGFWRYMYKIEPDFSYNDENDPYIIRGYTLTDHSLQSDGSTLMVYKNENGETVNVYHGSDEVDNITWQDEWQDNGFWNPNLIYFHNNVITIKEPTSLYFWLDFCDADVNLGELQQYRVDVAGRRSKYINDKDVKSIYFRETPNLLFIDTDAELVPGQENLNYCRINIAPPISTYFRMSGQGKSAKEVLDSLLYEHTFAQESISISCIPIYYLEPNTRIRVFDDATNINGEYIIKSFSIPLSYDGLMSISANRAVERIL